MMQFVILGMHIAWEQNQQTLTLTHLHTPNPTHRDFLFQKTCLLRMIFYYCNQLQSVYNHTAII